MSGNFRGGVAAAEPLFSALRHSIMHEGKGKFRKIVSTLVTPKWIFHRGIPHSRPHYGSLRGTRTCTFIKIRTTSLKIGYCTVRKMDFILPRGEQTTSLTRVCFSLPDSFVKTVYFFAFQTTKTRPSSRRRRHFRDFFELFHEDR